MQTPHDTLFHTVLRHPAVAAAWVQSVLPTAIAAVVDWSTFAPANGRLPGLGLRNLHADLVFVADLHGGEYTIAFVVEHSSGTNPGLHAQMLRYSVHVTHVLRRRATGRQPLVVPMALTHGGPPALTPPPLVLPPEPARALAAVQPQVHVLADDLGATDEAALRRRPLPPALQLTLLCLQAPRDRDAAAWLTALDRWGDLLRDVEADAGPPDPLDILDAVGWYLVDTSNLTEDDLRMAFSKHLDHPEHAPMTTGQRIRAESRHIGREEGLRQGIEQGIEQGIDRGLAQGLAQTLTRQLQRRFGDLPAEATQRIADASITDLEQWLDRVLDARDLAAVFTT